jgi:hypothetical protein
MAGAGPRHGEELHRGRELTVTVVVPVYNPGRHLAECAPSLLEYSIPTTDYEIVYVDDGSTDGVSPSSAMPSCAGSTGTRWPEPRSGRPFR